MPVSLNTPRKVVLRDVANATYVVAGNSSVSNVAAVGETITSAYISQVHWSTDARVSIKRGANTILNLNGNGSLNLRALGFSLSEFSNASIVVETTTANASVIIEIVKEHANGYGSGTFLTE